MKKQLPLIAFLLMCTVTALAQRIAPATSDAILARVAANADTTYIVNFWATWCAPCVKELPEFNKLQKFYSGKPVKVILVSLDFKEAYPAQLEKFVQKKKLLPETVWLSETDANSFVSKIAAEWTGSIPATLLLGNGGKNRKFIERTVTAEEIEALLNIR